MYQQRRWASGGDIASWGDNEIAHSLEEAIWRGMTRVEPVLAALHLLKLLDDKEDVKEATDVDNETRILMQ